MSGTKPPARRTHRYYTKSDRWTVLNVDDLERFFGTPTFDGQVRIDLDGMAQPSSDIPEGNVQVSFLVDLQQLLELARKIQEDGDRL